MAFSVNVRHARCDTLASYTLEDGTYFIGRAAASAIRLPYPDVSERHALVTLEGSCATIKDLRSANGTYVNAVAIDDPVRLDGDAVVQIGETILRFSFLQAGPEAAAAEPAAVREIPPARAQQPHPLADTMRKVKAQIHAELVTRLDLKRLTAQGVDRAGLESLARAKIDEIVTQVAANGRLPAGLDAERLTRDVFNEALRLGPLEDLLADDSVTEIMVNGPHRVYVERGGRLELSDLQFTDDASVMAVIARIVSPLGRRIDESQPYVDARLPDGSRAHAIIAPLSLSGPVLTIRKFARRALTAEDFIRFGTWTPSAAAFMRACVIMRKNIIVAGGTGSGKTTLLNVLSGFIPEAERIVTVEDAAELRLQQPHVVRLEARPPNIEGRGAVSIRDLVKNCLRMRPDRIIVGECRSGEALDMLQAMNTGHDGSLTTVHANSPRDVVSRLETMVLMSGMELPSRAIREQIAGAIDIIIHEARLADGSRRVVSIAEVTGMEGAQIVMQEIFRFRQTGVDAQGKIAGCFVPTGAVPTFFEQIKSRGLDLDASIFDPARADLGNAGAWSGGLS